MLVVYSPIVARTEQGSQFETIIFNPAHTSLSTIEQGLRSITDVWGEITIFQKPTNQGAVSWIRINPSDFWEARELTPKARDKFIRGVLNHMKKSPCVVFRWLPLVPTHSKRA